MFRSYEDPWKLEDELAAARARLEEAMQGDDDDAIMWATLEVQELEERVNFAWQDDEYDEAYAMCECGEEAW